MEAYIENDIPIPVNLKFCFEGMEESGSEGLDDLIFEQKDKFLKVVHAHERMPMQCAFPSTIGGTIL